MDDRKIEFDADYGLIESAKSLIKDTLEEMGFGDVRFSPPSEVYCEPASEPMNIMHSSIVLRSFDSLGPGFYERLCAKRLSKTEDFVPFHELYKSIALDSVRGTYSAPIRLQRYELPDPTLVAVMADFMERDGILEYSTKASVCRECGEVSKVSYRLTDMGRFWLESPPLEKVLKN